MTVVESLVLVKIVVVFKPAELATCLRRCPSFSSKDVVECEDETARSGAYTVVVISRSGVLAALINSADGPPEDTVKFRPPCAT